MSRKTRLTTAEFSQFKPKKRFNGHLFTLLVGASPDSGPRYACVVSKKTASRAVTRNLIKRRCRAAAQEHLSDIRDSVAIVFYARPSAAKATFADIKADVKHLFAKLTS